MAQEELYDLALPAWDQLPDFGLYMDQLLLYTARVYQRQDLVPPLTAGMINSYVKVGLIDRPQGKKYGRDSLAQLLMLCFLKQTTSMDSLKRLLHPEPQVDTCALYQRFRTHQRQLMETLSIDSAMTALDCALTAAVYQQAATQRMAAAADSQEEAEA